MTNGFHCFILFNSIGLYDCGAEFFNKTATKALCKQSNKHCGRKSTLPDAFQTMQKTKRKRGCHSDERYIKNDFHVTEFYVRHMTDRKYNSFARQSNDACRNFTTDPKRNHNNTDCTKDPLLPIKTNRYSIYTPDCKIRQISENKRDRELDQLNQFIFFAQDQYLKQDENTVHNNSSIANCQMSK